MTDSNDPLASIIATLKEPVTLSSGLTERVMAEIGDVTAPQALVVPRPAKWWRREWTIRVTPLRALAVAAGLAGVVVANELVYRRGGAVPAAGLVARSEIRLTQFVLVAPEAAAVTVVGDFNDWNMAATPLSRAAGDGVWSVTVPLVPGRYRYAFVVNGTIWRGDPEAPALEDDFGQPNSVVTIGGA